MIVEIRPLYCVSEDSTFQHISVHFTKCFNRIFVLTDIEMDCLIIFSLYIAKGLLIVEWPCFKKKTDFGKMRYFMKPVVIKVDYY